MDPRPPTPTEVLEELVNTLRASLMPVTTPQSASVCPMAMPASYVGDAAECGGLLPTSSTLLRNAASEVSHRTHKGSVFDFSSLWSSVIVGESYMECQHCHNQFIRGFH